MLLSPLVTRLIALLLAFLIPTGLSAIVYLRVRDQTVLPRRIGIALAIGVLAFLITYGIQSMTTPLWDNPTWVRLAAPILENSLILAGLLFFWRKRAIRGVRDGALYGLAMKLAFAIVENWLGVLQAEGGLGLATIVVRGFTTNPLHGTIGAMLGAAVGSARWQVRPQRQAAGLLASFVVIDLLHIVFNTLVSELQGIMAVIGAAIVALWGLLYVLAASRSIELGMASRRLEQEKQRTEQLLHEVIPLGVALSEERDFNRLLQRILEEARRFCDANGAILYLRTSQDRMESVIERDEALGIRLGGVGEAPSARPPLSLPAGGNAGDQAGADHPVIRAVQSGAPVSLEDAPARTLLCVPLKNAGGQVIGVIELANRRHAETRETISFDTSTSQVIESLAALAAVALVGYLRASALRAATPVFQIAYESEKVDQAVGEITDSDFFKSLHGQLAKLRSRKQPREAC